ncbi:hypothetical protein MOX02_57040 [Methylobacterium oxalidis]|uniref:Helix-hairpin-helix DNA-binding motif class 1 domain-containing protein n=2 Tax=Methylobacterium oxalidis TaxID=944322 RepID=A0A512JCI0_9HYPH|nr:hypothetical protein MOX02_57040 [Methylobacterium oxalidis]GJE34012.1 hypothetical protein LDDCCGHA_4216 [Methylobacterium oxalidis]GLS65998.1 hypothetical protein GCM10007888_43800 [Methylobacterium oxalidis]
MQASSLLVDPHLGAIHTGGKPVRLWPVLASGCLGLAAVGLLAAAVPRLMNHPPQQPVRPSSVLRVPLPAQTPGVAPSLTAEAMRQASPGLQTAAVQVRPQVAVQAVPTTVATVTGKAQSAPLVGLNTATLLELRRLPHIVKSQARAIISSRPYSSVAELAERKLVSARAYKAIRTRVDLH